MHKLSDLNVYGQTTVPFEDTRDYLIQWKYNVGALAVTIQEDQPRYISWQAEIDDIAGVELTGDTVEIAVTLLGNNDYVYFNGTAPNAVTLTDQGGGQYLISGIVTFTDWLWVRNNTLIKPPADRNTNWDYSVTITPPVGFSAKNWTVTVSYTGDGEEMSEPLDQEFDPGVPKSVYGHPVVTDVYNTAYSYRVVITSPDAVINTISSSGSGGTATWTSPTYTIQGTKTQVNSHLSTLVVDTDEVVDFTLTYTLTNLISATVTVVTQNWVETVLNTESENLGVARTYISNKINNLMSTDPIQIADGDLTGTYTVAVILNSDIGVFGLSSDTEFPPPEWTAGTLSWEFTGSEAECNTALSQLVFYPNKNTTSATTFTYRQFRGTTIQADATIAISGIANTETIPGEGVYTFTSNATFTPTFEQAHYLDMQVLIVGGGGAGGGVIWKTSSQYDSRVDSISQNSYGKQEQYSQPDNVVFYYVGGGAGGATALVDNPDWFEEANGSVDYDIVIGTGGTVPPIGVTPYIISTYAGTGNNTTITPSGGPSKAIAFGGYGGLSCDHVGNPLVAPGRTYSTMGYQPQVMQLNPAGSTYEVVPGSENTYYVPKTIFWADVDPELHPYTLPETDYFGDPMSFSVYYLRGGGGNETFSGNRPTRENGFITDISGTSIGYGAGGGIAYYSTTLTTPGSGGQAGVYDPGPDFERIYPSERLDDDGFQFTNGQSGIVIIKFTQPS